MSQATNLALFHARRGPSRSSRTTRLEAACLTMICTGPSMMPMSGLFTRTALHSDPRWRDVHAACDLYREDGPGRARRCQRQAAGLRRQQSAHRRRLPCVEDYHRQHPCALRHDRRAQAEIMKDEAFARGVQQRTDVEDSEVIERRGDLQACRSIERRASCRDESAFEVRSCHSGDCSGFERPGLGRP